MRKWANVERCGRLGTPDIGEALFLRPVDIRGLDLDAVVEIEKGKILLYPEPSASLRAEGQPASRSAGVSYAAGNSGQSLRLRARRASATAAAPGTAAGPTQAGRGGGNCQAGAGRGAQRAGDAHLPPHGGQAERRCRGG